MSDFTPGPWQMSGHETTLFGQPAECVSSKTMIVAVANPFTASHGNCQDIANARLIASAPDMHAELIELRALNAELVEALKMAMDWVDNWDPDFIHDPDWPDAANNIRTVLAKCKP